MNQRFGIALAMALCFGAVSLHAEAAEPKKAESGKKAGGKSGGASKDAGGSKKAGDKASKDAKDSKDAAASAKKADAKASKNAGAKDAPAAADSASSGSGKASAAQGDAAKADGAKGSGKETGTAPAAGGQSAAVQEQKKDGDKSAGDAPKAPEGQQAAGQSSSVRPWAVGVTPENQQKALRLFREGNTLLKDSVFGQAAVKYREALGFWDHPAIHYNMVLALLNMDRPTEVLQHLEKAMAYGPDPIDPEKFEQAKSYKALTQAQLTHLIVRCEEEGAVVSMDGQELFTAPGQFDGYVRPGPHSIVAKKEGFMNNEVSPALIAGGKAEYDMVLILAADAVEYRRRWAVWKPWTVFGAGIVVAGVGAALHISGRNAISDYDKEVEAAGNAGVDADDIKGKKDSGLRNQKIGVAMYGVGGAAIAAGATLLVMNRSKPYNPVTGELMDTSDKPKDEKKDEASPASPSAPEEKKGAEVSFLPVLSPDTAGMMATFRF